MSKKTIDKEKSIKPEKTYQIIGTVNEKELAGFKEKLKELPRLVLHNEPIQTESIRIGRLEDTPRWVYRTVEWVKELFVGYSYDFDKYVKIRWVEEISDGGKLGILSRCVRLVVQCFTHTYEYALTFSSTKVKGRCALRKAPAGFKSIPFSQFFESFKDVEFGRGAWEELKNWILRTELVKVLSDKKEKNMPKDYVFFPEVIDEKDRKKMNDITTVEIIRAMEQAEIDGAKMYAFMKTGRLVGEQNAKLLSKEDLKEWNDAIDDYKRLTERMKVEK